MKKDLPNASLASLLAADRLVCRRRKVLPQTDPGNDRASCVVASIRCLHDQENRRNRKFPDQERDRRQDKGPKRKSDKSVPGQAIKPDDVRINEHPQGVHFHGSVLYKYVNGAGPTGPFCYIRVIRLAVSYIPGRSSSLGNPW